MKLTKFFKERLTLPTMLGVTGEAEEERNSLALAAADIDTVTDVYEQHVAAAVAVDIQSYIKSVEKMGLDFRRPLNELAALIKRTQDEHLAPLHEQKGRVSRLLADFDAKERRRVEAEERARADEIARLESERIAKERAANEVAMAAAESGRKRDAKAAEQLALQAAAAETAVQTMIRAPLPEKTKAAGVAMKEVLRWEVTDIYALVKERPDLCKIEPKGSAIQAVCIPEMPNLPPGLKLWWEMSAVVSKR